MFEAQDRFLFLTLTSQTSAVKSLMLCVYACFFATELVYSCVCDGSDWLAQLRSIELLDRRNVCPKKMFSNTPIGQQVYVFRKPVLFLPEA